MTSKTQVGNLALIRIGVSQTVANVDTEKSRPALSLRLIFDDERDFVLRDFPWPWAQKYATGELVAGSSASPVNGDWTFAYRYPSDCLFVRRIVTPLGRKDTHPPPFGLGSDDQGRLIYTDTEAAEFVYTRRVTDPEEFDPIFVSMLAWKLGSVLAASLSRIEKAAQVALQMYQIERSKAEARALNEGQSDPPLDAEWVRDR